MLKARTIGELIVTLFAGAGTAITNPVVVPAIYSNYSTADYSLESMVNDGLIYDPDGQMTKAEIIESLGSYEIGAPRAFNLDTDGFRDLMSSNWQQMTDTGIDAVMRFNNIANTDSVYGAIDNLGQLFLDVANYGYLGAENMIAIVANPGTTVQVAFDNIKDAILQKYNNNIAMGLPIQTSIPDTAIQDGYKFGYATVRVSNNSNENKYLFCSGGNPILITNNSAYQNGGPSCWVANLGDTNCVVWRNSGVEQSYNVPSGKGPYSPILNLPPNTYGQIDKLYAGYFNIKGYGNSFSVNGSQGMEELFNSLVNDDITVPDNYSPDLVNQTQGNIYNPIEVVPNLTDLGLLEIIPQDDYVDLIDVINNNTDNGNPEGNAIVLDEFMQDYLIGVDNPGTDDPNEDPDQPVQPSIIPRPTNIPQETDDIINSLGTPGLETIFPFCLPFDLDYLFRKFQAEPKAPYFVLPLKSELFGIDEEVIVDLSMFDDIASLLRTLICIGYIVFLIFNTRSMIGAGNSG